MAARRYTIVFYIALVVAAGATYGVYRVIESTKASNRIATGPVVVANRDIREGERIDRLAVTLAQWPISTVPVGAYGRVDSVAGRVARIPIFRGEPLVPGRLAPEGTLPGLETKITPGRRAMSIRINDVSGVAGLIQPNSRVDILLITRAANNQQTSKIFMENMRVLAMQAVTQRSEDGRPIQASVASLEVTPEEAELLGVAQAQGQIQLVLRGYGDPDSVLTDGATVRELQRSLRNSSPPAPAPRRTASRPPPPAAKAAPPETVLVPVPQPIVAPPPKPETTRVEVIRGSKREEVTTRRDTTARDTTARDTLRSGYPKVRN